MFSPSRSTAAYLPAAPINRQTHNAEWQLPYYHSDPSKVTTRDDIEESTAQAGEQASQEQTNGRNTLGNVTNTMPMPKPVLQRRRSVVNHAA